MKPTRTQLDAPARDTVKESRPVVHPLSALLLVVVDGLWTLADWAAALWLLTIPLCFLAVAVPVTLIQKILNGDGIGRACALATVLGVLAAVPTPVMGTATGAVILALAGFRRFGPTQ